MRLSQYFIFSLLFATVFNVANNSFAQSIGNPAEWQVFNSSVLTLKKAYTTDDWNDYLLDDAPYPAFKFSYPATWKFNGYSVFDLSNEVKIAEISPGVVRMKRGQQCFTGVKSDGEILKTRPIKFGGLRGREIIVKFEDDSSHNFWYSHYYCLSNGQFGFMMNFFIPFPDSASEKTFEKIISTFKFIVPSPTKQGDETVQRVQK